MQDAAGFLFGHRVDRRALMVGQGLEGADREPRVVGNQHPGGDQRVPSEQCHEPGRARGDHSTVGMLRIEDPQRAEILDAALK